MKAEHKGKTIIFNEAEHSYKDNTGRVYTSTTTLIHKHFPEFDADTIAKRCAGKGKYEGMSVSEVLKAWDEKRDKACEKGTRIHNAIELFFKEGVKTGYDYIDNFYIELSNNYTFVEAEKIVFSPEWGISGTIDLIMRNKETGNLCIFDHKTNERINTYNKFQKGLGGLSHLYDCNFMHYSLQLNMYKALLNNQGYFDCENCEIALFHILKTKVNRIEIGDMENEIGIILLEEDII